MTQLAWSALLFAVLAALAWWGPEGEPGSEISRPVSGCRSCCRRHRGQVLNLAEIKARGWPINLPARP